MIRDIWASYRDLPLWVQIWVSGWLAPVNIATVFFISEQNGLWLFLLMLAGIAPNLPIMIKARGMSDLMALPHLVAWPLLLGLIVITLVQGTTGAHAVFLVVLLITDVISLVFDAIDFNNWRNSDQAIA